MHNLIHAIQVVRPPNACPLQHLNVLVGSYSDGESEAILRSSPVNFVDDSIIENVSSLHAGEKYYSEFELIDLNGLAVSTMITNFSK